MDKQDKSLDKNELVNELLGSALQRARRSTLFNATISTDKQPPSDRSDMSDDQTKEFHDSSVDTDVHNLMQFAMKRAKTTLNQQNDILNDQDRFVTPSGLLQSAQFRAMSTLNVTADTKTETDSNDDAIETTEQQLATMPKLMYRGNPAITNTALAHSLWATILRPQVDTAIDATCGNGHDSLALARLLFPTGTTTIRDSLSRLICIDLQQRACDNTRQAIVNEFGNDELLGSGHIQILHTSHSPLPVRWEEYDENVSVALVVYNLGWLPSNSEGSKEECITQMDTTLQSMVDAMLLLRIGGMISVVTYPKTNAAEDNAVRTFLECAALLSSNVETWQRFLEDGNAITEKTATSEYDVEKQHSIRKLVTESMERLVKQGDDWQTWRVSEHKKLGMDRAPHLLTATRIK